MVITIRILIPLVLICLPYLTTVECLFKGNHRPLMWLTNIPNSRKLNTLAFIGTRDPPTFEPSLRILPRVLLLSEKLALGIRVFDMGVRRINNDFAMYNSSFSMRAQFKDSVNTIKTFLKDNPEEFVIMIMHAESTAINSTLSECEILRTKYVQKYPNLFEENWSLDDTVGQHRGKILLLEKSLEFIGCTTPIPTSCVVRDQRSVYIANDISNLKYAEELQDEVNKQNSKCYIFYLTTDREINFPKNCNGTARINFIQIENRNPLQTIHAMKSTFNNTHNSFYTIVADLPIIDLIIKVVKSNTK